VVAAWVIVAVLLYRELPSESAEEPSRSHARTRRTSPSEGESSLLAIDRLVESEDERMCGSASTS